MELMLLLAILSSKIGHLLSNIKNQFLLYVNK